MAGLVSVTAAVVAALQPLADDATFRRIHHGPQEQINEFPCCEVIFGPRSTTRNQAVQLERQHVFGGVVRIYERRNSDLPGEVARLEPLVDAVVDLFGTIPRLDGTLDRFDATGNGAPDMGDVGTAKVVFVDVSWSVTDCDPGAYVQDW